MEPFTMLDQGKLPQAIARYAEHTDVHGLRMGTVINVEVPCPSLLGGRSIGPGGCRPRATGQRTPLYRGDRRR